MIRVPGAGRIENRAMDGAANPYLAYAAMLAAGLDGIERKLDPGPANVSNLYEVPEQELRELIIGFLPTTLREAIDCLNEDCVLRNALGVDYTTYYVDLKRAEWNRYHQSISQWELDQYLKIY
jgi:glutamine synthetase